jgi:hydrogenase nickel incorporation protein HypB
MVYAVTEGEEKPLKYPVMFRAAAVVVVNKVDLLPHLDFDMARFLGYLNDVNPQAKVIHASARTGQGIDQWCNWLLDTLNRRPQMTNTDNDDHDHAAPHAHDHSHGEVTHTHSHATHDHEHTDHSHDEHEHDDGTMHDHPHVHQEGLEDDHGHDH